MREYRDPLDYLSPFVRDALREPEFVPSYTTLPDGTFRLDDGRIAVPEKRKVRAPVARFPDHREAARRMQAIYAEAHAAGETVQLPFMRRRGAPEPAMAPRIPPVVTWDDHDANAGLIFEWLVKGLFPRRGVSLLWGQSGSGKSFVSLEAGACVATGQPFFGNRTKLAGGVLFALGEGAGTMPIRLDALRKARFSGEAPIDPARGVPMDLDRLPIGWLPVGELSKPGPFAAFAMAVREGAADMEARYGCKLRLVIVDTVVAAFGFPEDPDATSVTSAMKALDGLAQELDLCIVAIHHAGKTKSAGEHGSYAWRGSAETSIEVDTDRGNDGLGNVKERRLWVRKNRHGAEGWNRTFDLKSVALGEDEDGDEISLAIVVPFDPAAMDGITSGGVASVAASRFMDALWPAMVGAISLTTPDGSDVQAVRLTAVEGAHKQANPGKAASVKKKFGRDLDAAIAAGLIGKCDAIGSTFVWPMHANDNSEPAAGAPSHALNA